MKIFVLYDKAGIYSGRVLGNNLIKYLKGKALIQKGRPHRLNKLLRSGVKFDYIVNVGWYKSFDTKGALVLNAPEAVSLSSNKKKARLRFKTKIIPCPQLWLREESLTVRNLPVIARTTRHQKGTGLWFCKTMRDVEQAAGKGATHFLKFIPNTREFRVHVMSTSTTLEEAKAEDYRVIKLSEKVPGPRSSVDTIVKNHESGWIFGYPKNKKDPVLIKVREVGKKTLSVFGLHWGAVDIMVSKDTGEVFVLEINSTPCLTDDSANTLDKYSRAVCALIGLEAQPKKKNKTVTSPAALRIDKSKNKLQRFLSRQKQYLE